MSHWNEVLSSEQLEAFHALTNRIDPRFMIEEKRYYETRTIAQLRALSCGAWTANDGHGYQMARSYLAIAEKESAQ
jgi:hypothetical protein